MNENLMRQRMERDGLDPEAIEDRISAEADAHVKRAKEEPGPITMFEPDDLATADTDPAGMPVVWQFRKGYGRGNWSDWCNCGVDEYERLGRMLYAYEVRALAVVPGSYLRDPDAKNPHADEIALIDNLNGA